jgi:hypothetical protein
VIVIFDIAAPLVTYNLLRSAHVAAWSALLLSGISPAIGVTIGAVLNRRLDVVGALVLAGTVVGSIAGLVSHSTRLILVEGSVPTGVFAVACLGSLWLGRPLMYTFALEFIGPDSAQGREMSRLWHLKGEYGDGFRRVMRFITAIWGVGFFIEAVLRVIIVYNTSTGTALAISKVMPFVFAGSFSVWTLAYGTYKRKQGERMAPGMRRVAGTDHVDSAPDVSEDQ